MAVHQFIPALNPHDATGTHTLRTRDVLRRAGWRSQIFAEAIHVDLAGEAYKYWTYSDHAAKGDVAFTACVLQRILFRRTSASPTQLFFLKYVQAAQREELDLLAWL